MTKNAYFFGGNEDIDSLRLAFLSIHSSPVGKAGSKDTGGMSTYLRGLSGALAGKGHRVDIFTRQECAGVERVEQIAPRVRIISIDDGQGKLDKYDIFPYSDLLAKRIIDLCERDKLEYDLIFSHYWISGCVGRRIKKSWGLPHLIMFHTLGKVKNEACPGEAEPPVRLREEERLALECEAVITAAQLEKENVLRCFNLPAGRIVVIPSGVDRNLFNPEAANRVKLSFLKELLKDDYKIILAVGRIEPVKGFELAVETLALTVKKEKVRLLIAGGDSSSTKKVQSLMEKAEKLGVGDYLFFAGLVDHERMPLYYRAASATIIPSFYESFGLTALESVACGTPIVASPVGIMPELFDQGNQNGAAGYLVGGRNPTLWANALQKILSQTIPLDASEISCLMEPYDWDKIADSFVDHIFQLK